MYKPAYITQTLLPYAFVYGSHFLRVPSGLYNFIGTLLGGGDWTYLRVRQRDHAEIVKVIGRVAPDSLIVDRAVDSTLEQAFTAGALVDYVDTVAAVVDAHSPPVLVLSSAQAIVIHGHSIEYPLNITTDEAEEVTGTDSAKIVLGRKENAYGCCK